MKNALIAFDSFSFYCLASSHAVHRHQFCWPWRSIIPYFEQVLAHLLLNNEIPSVVQCNEIIQTLSRFPYAPLLCFSTFLYFLLPVIPFSFYLPYFLTWRKPKIMIPLPECSYYCEPLLLSLGRCSCSGQKMKRGSSEKMSSGLPVLFKTVGNTFLLETWSLQTY